MIYVCFNRLEWNLWTYSTVVLYIWSEGEAGEAVLHVSGCLFHPATQLLLHLCVLPACLVEGSDIQYNLFTTLPEFIRVKYISLITLQSTNNKLNCSVGEESSNWCQMSWSWKFRKLSNVGDFWFILWNNFQIRDKKEVLYDTLGSSKGNSEQCIKTEPELWNFDAGVLKQDMDQRLCMWLCYMLICHNNNELYF